MTALQTPLNPIVAFPINFGQRHTDPFNAALHIVGVPAAFIGVYYLCTRRFRLGVSVFVFGYALQFAGHAVQGNEVGEVTLVKHLVSVVLSGASA